MNTQTKSYKLKTTDNAIMPSQLPDIKIDYKALLDYAKEKGVKAGTLTDSEKERFISRL